MNIAAQAAEAYGRDIVPEPVITQEHMAQVRRIALHLAARLPASVELDDLIQAGMLGLMDAVRQYRNDRGARFETYASIRIRGAMIDELRRNDWAPRAVHSAQRDVSRVIHQIEQETGGEASESGIIERLGISAAEYREIIRDAAQCQVLSMTANSADETSIDAVWAGESPAEALENESFQQALAEGIQHLPERERLLMSLYYDDELNQREIGEVMGVTESRVCQLHGQALLRLKARLAGWRELATDAAQHASPPEPMRARGTAHRREPEHLKHSPHR